MSNKHFLPPPEEFFADDFPEEMTQEELTKMLKDLETKPSDEVTIMSNNIDLHLGAAEVKPFSKNSWIDQYGPKPPGPGIIALDILIVFLSCATVWFIINSWIYVFS
jgi:hypothetical protein